MATLIENLVGRGLNVEDYVFHARKFFCQPSKRTLAFAEKVLTRLDRKFADELEAWAESQTNRKKTEAEVVADLINNAQPEDEYAVAHSYGKWDGCRAVFDDGSELYWEPGEFAEEMLPM